MGVDVVHFVDAGHLECCTDGSVSTLAFGSGRGDVVRIAAFTKTDEFCVDFRTACFGRFVLFKHQCATALTHHKAVALRIEGTRGVFGIVVVGRERLHRRKSPNADGTDRRFAAHHEHAIGATQHDGLSRLGNRVRAGGAGRDAGEIGPFEFVLDGDETPQHIRQCRRNEKGADASWAAGITNDCVFFDGSESSDTRSRAHTEALALDTLVYSSIGYSLFGGFESQLDKSVGFFHIFGVEDRRGVEIFHLRRDAHTLVGSIEKRDGIHARFSAHDRIESAFFIMPQSIDHPKTGNNDSSQIFSFG